MSNIDLDMFDAQAPQGTVRYTLTGFHVRSRLPIVLIMKHAGESNTAFMNGKRKVDNRLRANGGEVTDAMYRAAYIPLYAETVVVGWENVVARDGQTPVPCTPDEVRALLTALNQKNGDVVSRAMAYAVPADHFRDVAPPEALGNG